MNANRFGGAGLGTAQGPIDFRNLFLPSSPEVAISGTRLDRSILLWSGLAPRLNGHYADHFVGRNKGDLLRTSEDVRARSAQQLMQRRLPESRHAGGINRPAAGGRR